MARGSCGCFFVPFCVPVCAFLWLQFFIDGPAFFLPFLKATKQCCCVFDSFCLEDAHRTGGRMLVGSRTVSDNHLVTRELAYVIRDLACGNEL